ncbi:MAG: AlpA family phage regulatory protein [Gammaproteobacteria bacterium]|nr:AlpA family phage regulatory protein [Gammaproteobacteria bacterium]
MAPRILRIGEVARRTGLSEATLYRMAHTGRFPTPVRLGKRAIGWRREDVDEWVDDLQPAYPENVRHPRK